MFLRAKLKPRHRTTYPYSLILDLFVQMLVIPVFSLCLPNCLSLIFEIVSCVNYIIGNCDSFLITIDDPSRLVLSVRFLLNCRLSSI